MYDFHWFLCNEYIALWWRLLVRWCCARPEQWSVARGHCAAQHSEYLRGIESLGRKIGEKEEREADEVREEGTRSRTFVRKSFVCRSIRRHTRYTEGTRTDTGTNRGTNTETGTGTNTEPDTETDRQTPLSVSLSLCLSLCLFFCLSVKMSVCVSVSKINYSLFLL